MGSVHGSIRRLGRLNIRLAVTWIVTMTVFLSPGPRALWSFDLAVAHAEASIGSGPPFFSPTDIAVETSGGLVVLDRELAAVLRIDPASGDRTILSGSGSGSGPDFSSPSILAVEAAGTLVVMNTCCGFEPFNSYMLRVDPVSGDRTLVSGSGAGSGPDFWGAGGVAVEASGTLVVVGSYSTLSTAHVGILRVDPVSGDRTVVSGPDIGNGPAFVGPLGIAVEASGTLVVVDDGLDAVLRVDPLSGDRTVISQATTGSGPAFDRPQDIMVEATGALVVLDVGTRVGRVLRVDPISGDRTVVSGEGVGRGPLFGIPQGLAVESTGALVLVDRWLHAVIRVDPVSGDRTVVSR